MWRRIDLTISKTPVLQDNERVQASEQNVCIYKGEEPSKYARGWLYLTDSRLCYVDDVRPEEYSIALNLDDVEIASYQARFMRSSGKIRLTLSDQERPAPQAAIQSSWVCEICTFSNQLPKTFVFGRSALPACENCGVQASEEAITASLPVQTTTDDGPPTSGEVVCPRCTFHNHPSLVECEMCGVALKAKARPKVMLGSNVKLSFRGGGSKQFYAKVRDVLDAHKARHKASDNAEETESEQDVDRVARAFGIHSIEQAASSKHERGDAVLAEAFADLRALMSRAEEVIKLVEAYGNNELVASLGIGGQVSKDAAGGSKTFYHQLAREVTDFLDATKILANEGGAMTLHDLYAIYNRSRGIELVSPSDLRKAVALADEMGLPLRLRKLHSGVLIVEEKLYIPTYERLAQWISRLEAWQADAGVSAQDVSNHFGWSLYIATEELEQADLQGSLCRDEQPQAVRYFVNKILVP